MRLNCDNKVSEAAQQLEREKEELDSRQSSLYNVSNAKALLDLKLQRLPWYAPLSAHMAEQTKCNLELEIEWLHDEEVEYTMMKAEKEFEND